MTVCPEHPKRDQNPKFTPLSETTSIPVHFIWGSPPHTPPPPPPGSHRSRPVWHFAGASERRLYSQANSRKEKEVLQVNANYNFVQIRFVISRSLNNGKHTADFNKKELLFHRWSSWVIITDVIVFVSILPATTLCYGKYGCFFDDPPFENSLIAPPLLFCRPLITFDFLKKIFINYLCK